jgi:long-subunit acyl-CoA synthetase (AMP-forming)
MPKLSQDTIEVNKERISGLYNRLYAGASTYFVDDLTKLWDYMLELKPTVFASLPRFFKKVHVRGRHRALSRFVAESLFVRIDEAVLALHQLFRNGVKT